MWTCFRSVLGNQGQLSALRWGIQEACRLYTPINKSRKVYNVSKLPEVSSSQFSVLLTHPRGGPARSSIVIVDFTESISSAERALGEQYEKLIYFLRTKRARLRRDFKWIALSATRGSQPENPAQPPSLRILEHY